MDLRYEILWFEDEKEWFESVLPFVEEILEDYGFVPDINIQEDDRNLEDLIDDPGFDLILMDYRLAGILGDKLIGQIRDHNIYTDIVFYSQDGEGEIRGKVLEKGLDGVFCADRNRDDFLGKVSKVIQSTIRKVGDLNNLRGLVIAETCDLDVKMEELIEKLVSSETSEVRSVRINEIFTRLHKSTKDRLKQIEKLDKRNLSVLIDQLDSFGKFRSVKKLLKHQNDDGKNDEFIETIETYKKDVIDIRNLLAHVFEIPNQEGGKSLISKIPGYERFEFTDKSAKYIRINLKKHMDNINAITGSIS